MAHIRGNQGHGNREGLEGLAARLNDDRNAPANHHRAATHPQQTAHQQEASHYDQPRRSQPTNVSNKIGGLPRGWTIGTIVVTILGAILCTGYSGYGRGWNQPKSEINADHHTTKNLPSFRVTTVYPATLAMRWMDQAVNRLNEESGKLYAYIISADLPTHDVATTALENIQKNSRLLVLANAQLPICVDRVFDRVHMAASLSCLELENIRTQRDARLQCLQEQSSASSQCPDSPSLTNLHTSELSMANDFLVEALESALSLVGCLQDFDASGAEIKDSLFQYSVAMNKTDHGIRDRRQAIEEVWVKWGRGLKKEEAKLIKQQAALEQVYDITDSMKKSYADEIEDITQAYRGYVVSLRSDLTREIHDMRRFGLTVPAGNRQNSDESAVNVETQHAPTAQDPDVRDPGTRNTLAMLTYFHLQFQKLQILPDYLAEEGRDVPQKKQGLSGATDTVMH